MSTLIKFGCRKMPGQYSLWFHLSMRSLFPGEFADLVL